MRTRAHARGQGTVETLLGLLVFVTVLAFGIHFAELAFLSLKVHEAATAALWDTTARPPHQHARRSEAIHEAGTEATRAYAGFDGRSAARGRGSAVQVLTRGWDLQVRCEEDATLVPMPRARLDPFPGRDGGMRCAASARLGPRAGALSRRFLDGERGGLFQARNVMGPDSLEVCALGRPDGRGCGGAYVLLLDEWALSGPEQSRSCTLAGCENPAYRRLVGGMYEEALRRGAGAPSAEAFARALVQRPPPGAPSRTFHFSFQDSPEGDPGFTPGDGDEGRWMTNVRTGSRNIRYWDRGARFLGLEDVR
jgi:hypothetical protein